MRLARLFSALSSHSSLEQCTKTNKHALEYFNKFPSKSKFSEVIDNFEMKFGKPEYTEDIKTYGKLWYVNEDTREIYMKNKKEYRRYDEFDNINCYIENYEKNIINGKCIDYYEDGNTSSIINYMNNQRNGESTYYYLNNELKIRAIYKNGLLHGICIKRSLLGRIEAICMYEEGKMLWRFMTSFLKDF